VFFGCLKSDARRPTYVVLGSSLGELQVAIEHEISYEWDPDDFPSGSGRDVVRYHKENPRDQSAMFDFWSQSRLNFGTRIRPSVVVTALIPFWAILGIFGMLPAWRVRSLLTRWRRQSRRLCVQCGYDIRFSSGRCPECGQRVTPATTSNGHARVG
jgi:hypothetical protein